MKVLVAGGSGTLGVPLVRALVGAGHDVVATTRSPEKQPFIQTLGATSMIMDALDAPAVERVLQTVSPDVVVHQLTALPKAGPKRARDLAATNRLRDEGTRHLLGAAIAAGARRFIGGSFAILGAWLQADPSAFRRDPAAAAIRSMESQILDAARRRAIDGLVLRYGLFYGPGAPSTDEMFALVRRRRLPQVRGDRGQLPSIHLADAVAATVAAIERGVSGRVYEIVDDTPMSFSEMVRAVAEIAGAPEPLSVPAWLMRVIAPYMARLFSYRYTLSNATAQADLGWAPVHPSYRDGLLHMRRAAV
jgi:nucleoside-diphosphate-sugar epimerase